MIHLLVHSDDDVNVKPCRQRQEYTRSRFVRQVNVVRKLGHG